MKIQQAETELDLVGILDLQRENLLQNISEEEKNEQGFVRVEHNLELLSKLNSIEQHLIAKEGDQVVAYVLAMTKASRADVPMLVPMFEQFDKIQFKNRPIKDYNYITVGQVCIGKTHRGQGLFSQCYQAYKSFFASKYDFAITEISLSNLRSLKAHQKMGFETIHQFKDEFETWAIVLWDWTDL